MYVLFKITLSVSFTRISKLKYYFFFSFYFFTIAKLLSQRHQVSFHIKNPVSDHLVLQSTYYFRTECSFTKQMFQIPDFSYDEKKMFTLIICCILFKNKNKIAKKQKASLQSKHEVIVPTRAQKRKKCSSSLYLLEILSSEAFMLSCINIPR